MRPAGEGVSVQARGGAASVEQESCAGLGWCTRQLERQTGRCMLPLDDRAFSRSVGTCALQGQACAGALAENVGIEACFIVGGCLSALQLLPLPWLASIDLPADAAPAPNAEQLKDEAPVSPSESVGADGAEPHDAGSESGPGSARSTAPLTDAGFEASDRVSGVAGCEGAPRRGTHEADAEAPFEVELAEAASPPAAQGAVEWR